MKMRAIQLVVAAIVSLLAAAGCQEAPESEPVAEQKPAPPPPPAPVEAPEPEPPPAPKPAAQPAEGALGTPRWVKPKGNGWIMIEGLDGGRYENYYPSVVKNVQTALQTEGLYGGAALGRAG